MGEEKVIVVSSVGKRYEMGGFIVEALKNVNLEVFGGEFMVLCGPSGAGKTTLLNIIGGLDMPTLGKVVLFGRDLSGHEEEFLATFRCVHVGYVFQSYNLISTLTALENIAFAMELAGWSGRKIEQRAEALLELVGLSGREQHLPSQLSGGEQQRAAFARALANDPPLFIADEPTGNLDLNTGLKIIEILRGLKGEKTIVVASHDPHILEVADRVITMSDGRIISNA